MFKLQPKSIEEILQSYIREQGLETPLLQKRLIDSWAKVAGPTIATYTDTPTIRNQTLYVHVRNAALRADLSMMRTQMVKALNDEVQAQVIADIIFR